MCCDRRRRFWRVHVRVSGFILPFCFLFLSDSLKFKNTSTPMMTIHLLLMRCFVCSRIQEHNGADDDEHDTTERQSRDVWESLLRLNSTLGSNGHSLVHAEALWSAWVPQPSPCCAAAVVAAVLNVLTPCKTWTTSDIIPYYVAMTDQRIGAQRKKLFGLLQPELWSLGSLDRLTVSVREKLVVNYELKFGDTSKAAKRRDVKLTKQLMLQVARETMADGSVDVPPTVVRAIFPPPPDDLDTAPSELGECSQRPTSHGVSFEIPLRAAPPRWKQCQEALYQYWHLIDGREKLLHASRPSTAICGNAALLFALEMIAEQERVRVFGSEQRSLKGEFLVGSGSESIFTIEGPQDTEVQKEAAWRGLWTAFQQANTALVYHMKNHYALIFALREWRTDDGQPQRELLTARRGQRPSSWICWEEAYETMAGWNGYKILCFSSVIDTKISSF